MSFHALNQAMLSQVLHELRQGHLQRCKALGLAEAEIERLIALSPAILARLAFASVSWVQIHVDPPVLHRLIEQAERDEQNERLITRALRLGASSNIMYRCFGLLHSETALRRRLLKIDSRRGRPHSLTEAQEHALWQRWRQLAAETPDANPAERLDAMLQLAEEQQVPLTAVWQQINLYGGGTP